MIQRGVLNETIQSAVSEIADTSSYAPTNAPLQKTVIKSKKLFMVATHDVAQELEKAEPPYDMCIESKEVDLISNIQGGDFQRKGICWYIINKNSSSTTPPSQTLILKAKQC